MWYFFVISKFSCYLIFEWNVSMHQKTVSIVVTVLQWLQSKYLVEVNKIITLHAIHYDQCTVARICFIEATSIHATPLEFCHFCLTWCPIPRYFLVLPSNKGGNGLIVASSQRLHWLSSCHCSCWCNNMCSLMVRNPLLKASAWKPLLLHCHHTPTFHYFHWVKESMYLYDLLPS